MQVRQGDVLIESVKMTRAQLLKRGGNVLPRDNGRVVLAYGEATGHAHALVDTGVELIELETGERFLYSPEGGTLKHEEHAAIAIPPGIHRVIHPQIEYHPQELRSIAD